MATFTCEGESNICVVDILHGNIWYFSCVDDLPKVADNTNWDLRADHMFIYDVGFWGSREHPKRMYPSDVELTA